MAGHQRARLSGRARAPRGALALGAALAALAAGAAPAATAAAAPPAEEAPAAVLAPASAAAPGTTNPDTAAPAGAEAAAPGDGETASPGGETTQPPLEQGTTLAPPPETSGRHSSPESGSPADGGTAAGQGKQASADGSTGAEEGAAAGEEATVPVPNPAAVLSIPSLPASSCAPTGVPPVLIPIFQRAAAAYGLGPQGAAVLAGINEVETGFGANVGPSSAGAVGWMQFMPATWGSYGVDANGDGTKDPYNPEDAIFAAAGYLSANGMPADTYGAIYAYNHADWYVQEVLANAGCYAGEVGDPAFSADDLGPQIEVLRCSPAAAWKKQIPAGYLKAFEGAAARYELGKRGVWTLAAIARLGSNFGRGMTKQQLNREGPLGLDGIEWRHFAVDGDGDGRVRHADIADSAATLAREIWSRGGLEAGVFAHNQAAWYVEEVMREAAEIEGGCQVSYVAWRVAPLSSGFETPGPKAVLSNGLASAPRDAPPAVKAAIAAANSISTTPYVWGGGHGSWYSYGYDCSGAVSFALYGAGLLDAPLTSGELESYGEPGPGKWITIYANATHTYAVIAGLRWDTVGDANGSGPRWHDEGPYPEGFVVRHPVGY